ncbi:hypothetical protein ACFVHQ_06495 [Actinomycetes bacterium NPDC127524]
MGEGITGRDFLGNKLTEEQKQQSLIQAFSILGLGAASKFIGGKPANIPFNTYSKQYAQATAKNAQNTLREIGKQIGKVDVPVGAKVLKMATNGPIQPKVLAIKTKTLSEVKQGLGEKIAKKKEQKQVNKELSGGRDNGITKDEYKNLRKKTPSNDIRKMVNPEGPKVDPVYGYEVDKFEADHIVSMKEITEMDVFGILTKEQQIEILNLKDNFIGLGKSSNASKGAHSWADWNGHSKMGEVPVNVRMEMLEKEKHA